MAVVLTLHPCSKAQLWSGGGSRDRRCSVDSAVSIVRTKASHLLHLVSWHRSNIIRTAPSLAREPQPQIRLKAAAKLKGDPSKRSNFHEASRNIVFCGNPC